MSTVCSFAFGVQTNGIKQAKKAQTGKTGAMLDLPGFPLRHLWKTHLSRPALEIYPVHAIIRHSVGVMTRKLSVTSSQ